MAQTNDEIIYDPQINTIREYCTNEASDILLGIKAGGKESDKEDWINWRISLIMAIANKEKQKARLAVLDDCKTTLKWQFGEWAKISNDSKEKGEGFRQGIMKAVEIIDAELEALRKKVEG